MITILHDNDLIRGYHGVDIRDVDISMLMFSPCGDWLQFSNLVAFKRGCLVKILKNRLTTNSGYVTTMREFNILAKEISKL